MLEGCRGLHWGSGAIDQRGKLQIQTAFIILGIVYTYIQKCSSSSTMYMFLLIWTKGCELLFFFSRCHKNSHLAFLWIPNPAFQRHPSAWDFTLLCETVTPSSINGPLLGIGPTSGSTSDAPFMIQDSSWEVCSISLHPDLSASLQPSAQAASWLPLWHLFCHNNSALHIFFQKSWSQRQLKELSIRSNLHLVWLWPETIFLLLRITITTGTFRSSHAWQAFSSVILWQLCKYYH